MLCCRCGPTGLTTEAFVKKVAERLDTYLERADQGFSFGITAVEPPVVDNEKMDELFKDFDADRDGMISKSEFTALLVKLGVAPMKEGGEKLEKDSDV